MISFIVAFLMLVILSYTDYKEKKIPNSITFPCFIIGIFLSGIDSYWSLVFILFAFCLGALNLLPMGDVKMYMALCFLCGYKISVFVLLLSQLLLIVFHFVKRGKNGVNEIKTVSYPLAPFVLIAYIVIVILYIGGVL